MSNVSNRLERVSVHDGLLLVNVDIAYVHSTWLLVLGSLIVYLHHIDCIVLQLVSMVLVLIALVFLVLCSSSASYSSLLILSY